MLSQGFYYARKGSVQLQDEEERPLLPNKIETEIMEHPSRPSFLCQVAVAGIFIGALIAAILVWTDKMEFLDWLYYASSVKLFISLVKYMPQVYLNWRKSNLRGFAIGNIIAVRTTTPISARTQSNIT
jgi:cystinosin